MADLDRLRLEAEQIQDAEQLAIAGLAQYLEEAVETLPDESTLCRFFYGYSVKFAELAAWHGRNETMAALTVMRMEKDLREQQEEE
jgi:hypothetical protein